MPPDDALTLFATVAGVDRTAAEPASAREVLRLCGYLPLAIRIGAARLAARPTWTVGSPTPIWTLSPFPFPATCSPNVTPPPDTNSSPPPSGDPSGPPSSSEPPSSTKPPGG